MLPPTHSVLYSFQILVLLLIFLYIFLSDTLGAFYDPPECGTIPQRPNSKCTLKCPGGNAIHGGPDTLTCREDGTWSSNSSFGTCSSVCEALMEIPHAEIQPKSCTEGFVKTGK